MIASACLLTTLASCGSSGKTEPKALPVLPADLKVCFNEHVPAPTQGPLTKSEVLALIADLKRSEMQKSLCGQRLVAFYESLL